MERQYRMLRGRGGATGYARGDRRQGMAMARGLTPGGACSLYRMRDGQATLCDQGTIDGQGTIGLKYAGEGALFMTDGSDILLWEDGAEQARLRLQAREWLSGQAARQSSPEKAEDEPPAEEAPPVPEQAETEAEAEAEPQPEEPAAPEAEPPREQEESWQARPESKEAPADDLPELYWPEAAAELKPYFEQCAPIAPFDAPGWRFVQVPSPLRGIPYCAVGYHAQDSRVVQVAYAVPGTPYQAPAALPGYRYQIGREGKGYWTLWRSVQ